MHLMIALLAAVPTYTVYFVLYHYHYLLLTTVYIANGVVSMACEFHGQIICNLLHTLV